MKPRFVGEVHSYKNDQRPSVVIPDLRGAPEWFAKFLSIKYFQKCEIHHDGGQANAMLKYFCIDCQEEGNKEAKDEWNCKYAHCQLCRMDHEGHRVIQLRLLANTPSVIAGEIAEFVDLSGLFMYRLHSTMAVFLRSKKKPKEIPTDFHCEVCKRYVSKKLENERFCSLECKVVALDDDRSITFLPGGRAGRPPKKRGMDEALPPKKRGRAVAENEDDGEWRDPIPHLRAVLPDFIPLPPTRE